MIKLIASDLDGTLLRKGAQRPDASVFTLIEELRERGILFAAASGRQYPNLRRMFAPVWKDILFICENGALVMYQGKVLSSTEIERELGIALLRDILATEDCEALLSVKNTSYLQPKTPEFVNQMLNRTRNTITIVDDLCVVDEPFLKISVYDKRGIATHSAAYFQEKWNAQITGSVAGFEWLDFTIADKGSAIAEVCRRFGFRKEELVAFGDNFNDVPMLQAVGRAYVMESADPRVKAFAMRHTFCVEDSIRALLAEG